MLDPALGLLALGCMRTIGKSDAGAPRQHYGLTLAVLLVAALAFAIAQTMVVPALPAIQSELGTSTEIVTFVLTAFLLTASVATPIVGRLGDMFGKERMLVAVLSMFALGSLVCALSESIGALIAGRAIQGVAGGVLPLAFGIIRDEFPPRRVATGLGLISASFGVGGAVGLVSSGLIVDHLSYEWIFWLSLLGAGIAIPAVRLFVPPSPVTSPARIDWGGAALLAAGLVALLIGLSLGNGVGWDSAPIVALLAGSLVVLTVWVAYERRVHEPLVDMAMMRRRPVLMTNLTALLTGFGMFGSFLLIPQLVQTAPEAGYGFGATVTEAGLFMLPSAALIFLAGPISGLLGTRFGSKLPLVLGSLFATASFVFLAVLHDAPWSIYAGTALLGAGLGFSFAAMPNLIVEAVDQRQTGVATGMNAIMRTIGGALGGQIAASIVASGIGSSGLPAESGFTIAFALSAVTMAAALLLALAVPGRPRSPRPERVRRPVPAADAA